MDTIQDVLIYQTQMMRNSSLGPYVQPEFSPPEHIVIVNALFYASLGVMILAAFIAMLIKSWVREFDRGLRALSISEQRAKTREFRYLGMERWKLPEMVGILPLLIQISLLLFSIGLVLFLFHISKPSFGVTTAIFGIGVLYYAITTSISLFVTSSPFHSPLSRTLGKLYQYVHAYFCPDIHHFFSSVMDIPPATVLGRVRRGVQVILQKSRPYLEKDFVEPITATTIDEVQLSTAASALRRIHDSAPDSQHSEALHLSVWQVASSGGHLIPSLFHLPSWVLDRVDDAEYLSHLPPAILIVLVAISLRTCREWNQIRALNIWIALRRMRNSNDPWAHVVTVAFDRFLEDNFGIHYHIKQPESNHLTSMIRTEGLHREECLWLLRTLSELCSEDWLLPKEPSFVRICLPILMNHATKWRDFNPPDIILLEAVVTLGAISCSPDTATRLNILSSSRDHPWLLLNIRNTNLISILYEGTPPDDHTQLTSLLFLIFYALLNRQSYALAHQYFNTITARGGFPLWASALTAIAPAIPNIGLSAIGRMLLARQTRESILGSQVVVSQDELATLGASFDLCDEQLGASENPDPNILAILLMLSKQMNPKARMLLQYRDLDIRNPWLMLAARAIAELDIPDGFTLPTGLSYDHRVHNMVAALSLLPYTRRNITHYTNTNALLLASFLQSRDLTISYVALEYYMKTIISYSDPPAPSCHLSAAVSSAFNAMLPEEQLWERWKILHLFVDEFEALSAEWGRRFAEGFFTLSRRPLPKPRGEAESSTPKSELEAILTWEYFHGEEQELELTDSHFSGLDWMAMAWSLYLSQQSGRKKVVSRQGKAQLQKLSGLAVNEEFVFRALCRLLDAAPYQVIIPIIHKLREFMQWFDATELPEYRSTISNRVNEATRRHEESQILHRFRNFNCVWYN